MKNRNPNWRPEELKLALLLYISHDFEWLSSMTDATDEIVDLSKKLNKLPFIQFEDRGKNFRSPSSVRMKLTNFKALDNRYGKSALSNISKADQAIWNEYHNNIQALIKECDEINRLLNTEVDEETQVEAIPYASFYCFCRSTIRIAQHYKKEAQKQIESDEADLIKVVCSKLINASNLYLEENDDLVPEDNYVEHGGVNKAPINRKPRKKKEKQAKAEKKPIGKYVREELQRLNNEGLIGDEQIECFLSKEWSREIFHIGHSFFRKVSEAIPLKEQMKDKNGHQRYWKDEYIT